MCRSKRLRCDWAWRMGPATTSERWKFPCRYPYRRKGRGLKSALCRRSSRTDLQPWLAFFLIIIVDPYYLDPRHRRSREAEMKKRFVVLLAVAAGLCASPAFAQFGSVKGVCKDKQGKPIAGAVVEFHAVGSARVYKLKTDNSGEYSSLGIMLGRYNVSLVQDGQEVFHLDGVVIGTNEKQVDLDLQHEQEQAAQQKGMTPDQLKESQGAQAKQTAAVKALNDALLAANQALQAGDFDAAIKGLTAANEVDPSHDLIWAKLGGVNLASAPKQTDSDERKKRYTEAVNDYQKAIDLLEKKPKDPKAPPPNLDLAGYYNNLAHAQAKSGKLDDAVQSYNQAIQLDPSGTAQYNYNLGAILMNAGRTDEAIAAFDKSIAADPSKPDAYFQKGSSLVAKATADEKGKITAPPGTAEVLNKYLELAPNGQFVGPAKTMIQYIGGTIETGYKQRKKN